MGNKHGHHHNSRPPQYNYGPHSAPTIPNYGQYSGNSAPTASNPIANSNMGLRLPYAHVDLSLRGLAGQAEGFGRLALGGLNGAVYRVTTLAGKE